jgi:hypothetical protein
VAWAVDESVEPDEEDERVRWRARGRSRTPFYGPSCATMAASRMVTAALDRGRMVAANSVRVYLPFAALGSRLAATANNRRMNGSITLDYARKRFGVSDRRAKRHWRCRCSEYFSDDGPFELAAETCPGERQMRVRKERENAALTVRIEPVQNLVGRDDLPMGLWRRPHGTNS